MAKYQFHFTNNDSTEVDGESIRWGDDGYVEVRDGNQVVVLMAPRERLNYVKKINDSSPAG